MMRKGRVISCRITDEEYRFLKQNKVNVSALVRKAIFDLIPVNTLTTYSKEKDEDEVKLLRWWNEFIFLQSRFIDGKLTLNILKRGFIDEDKKVIETILAKYKVLDIPKILLGCFWDCLTKRKTIQDIKELPLEQSYNTFNEEKDKILNYLSVVGGFDVVRQAKIGISQ